MLRSFFKTALIIFLIAVAIWLLRRTEIIPAFKNPFAAQPTVIDETPLLVKNIRSIAQLMTIEYYDEVVVDSTRNSSRLVPLPPFVFPLRASLVLVVKGRLLAGLNLQKLDSSHFSGTRDSIMIRLPKAQVLEVIINPTDVETFSEKGDWTQAAVAALKIKARDQMIRNALAQGVLQRSDEKARNLIEQLMLNAGYKRVVIGY